ncbi:hypothetical protein Hanom_Chr03g00250951 [Helianthus anomalus]
MSCHKNIDHLFDYQSPGLSWLTVTSIISFKYLLNSNVLFKQNLGMTRLKNEWSPVLHNPKSFEDTTYTSKHTMFYLQNH